MSRQSVFTVLALVFALVFFTGSANAEQKYPIKRVKFADFNPYAWQGDWVATTGGSSLMFFFKTGVTLETRTLDARGKVGEPVEFYTAKSGIADCQALWTGKTGVLLVLTHDNITDKTVLTSVRFDEAGKKIGSAKKVFEHVGHSDDTKLMATVGGEHIAYVVSIYQIPFNPNGIELTQSYIGVTDLNGKYLGPASRIKLPAGDLHHYFQPGKPHWTGNRWLVPATSTRFKIEYVEGHYSDYFYVPQGNNLYLLSGKGLSTRSPKLKLRSLESDETSDWPTYRNAYILPEAVVAPTAKQQWRLLAQHISYLPGEQRLLRAYDSEVFLVPLGAIGQRTGDNIALEPPVWTNVLEPESDKLVSWHIDSFSEALANGDGSVTLAHMRSITRFWWSDRGTATRRNYDYDNMLALYKLDPVTGAIEQLSSNVPKPDGRFAEQQLESLGGEFVILSLKEYMRVYDNYMVDLDSRLFISRFK